MGQTNPNYPVFEVALSCEHGGTHTNGTKERKCVGDIIALRRPAGAVGRLERAGYLWLRIEGLEENDMARLTDQFEENGQVFDKRRYCIPFERLAQVASFDVNRAKDLGDNYQPFLNVDEDVPYRFLNERRPLNVHGLVYDKAARRYI